jgi:oligopeptide/dipeptide ABC transporter ATP-binding protein
VVSNLAHRVAVMFLGRIVETGPPEEITERPVHPYTQALISAIPVAEPSLRGQAARIVLTGDIPSPKDKPTGCAFRTRCWRAQTDCQATDPTLSSWEGASRKHACLHPSTSTDGASRRAPIPTCL